MDTHEYQPLPLKGGEKWIRLVRLLPGEPIEGIQCRLLNFSLAETPLFIALSYCWGELKFKRPLLCNGAILHVLSNLYSALQHLRRRDRPEWLWADAICINQRDVQERNSQVLLMRDIYSHARQTTVWLGDSSVNSYSAMALIPRLALVRKQIEEAGPEEHHRLIAKAANGYIPNNLPPISDPGYRGIALLLHRPWFSRVWIIQELAVSKLPIVQCGVSSVLWTELVRAVTLLYALNHLTEEGENFLRIQAIEATRLSVINGNEMPLLPLLISYRSFQATDPKDKIYALYGVANRVDMHKLSLVPNYALSTAEAYSQLATTILRNSNNLDILSVPRIAKDSAISTHPSWVPDWTSANDCFFLRSRRKSADRYMFNFQATPPAHGSEVTFADADTVLGLSGHFVDIIDQVGVVPEMENLQSKRKHRMTQYAARYYLINNWERVSLARSGTAYITGGTHLDAYWQTIIVGDITNGYLTTKEEFMAWNKFNNPGIIRHLPLGNTKGLLTLIGLFSLLHHAFQVYFQKKQFASLYKKAYGFLTKAPVLLQRRIFRTKKGYIGLASEFAQEGDRIGLFKGGAVPLVARPNGKRWNLIGDCYVHGIMNGEAFKEEDCETVWFV
jgi:hypothetical protein